MAIAEPAPNLAFMSVTNDTKTTKTVTSAYDHDHSEFNTNQIDQSKTAFRPKTEGWEEPSLTVIGLYYPLGPCQKRFARSQLKEILENLPIVFRALSLQTKYHNSPISAECRSLDLVGLEVVILAARDDSECVLLEVCRREGDSYSYHCYAQQILLSVSGPEPIRPIMGFSWNLEALSKADRVAKNHENVAEALEIASNMLSSERFDARKLAVESLVHMTDPHVSGWATSQIIANCLLDPKESSQERLSEELLTYAAQETCPLHTDDSTFEKIAEAEVAYLCLVVLSNLLQVAAAAKNIDVQTFLKSSRVVDFLVEKVVNVQEHPHHAYYATQCLLDLCTFVPKELSRINRTIIEQAQLFGESSHYALATVSQKLLVNLHPS